MDMILSYLIEIPCHPRSATFPNQAIKKLFSSQVLHVNRILRQKSIYFITHRCLWIHIGGPLNTIWEHFNSLRPIVPHLPSVYQQALPCNLPGVRFILDEREDETPVSRSYERQQQYFVFPFNYHTFAALFGVTIAIQWKLQSVRISVSDLSGSMQTIVDTQILPIVPLLRAHSKVSMSTVAQAQSNMCIDLTLSSSIANKMDLLLSMVLTLDALGRELEGSILCLYCGQPLMKIAERAIENIEAFTRRSLMKQNWLYNSSSLDRMRLVRTLFYIESRAQCAYIEGYSEYGMEFALAHLKYIGKDSVYGADRWIAPPSFSWFGLPDHEFASLQYMHSQVRRHNYQVIEHLQTNDSTNPMLNEIRTEKKRGTSTEAARHALLAWDLDFQNLKYAGEVERLMRECTSRHFHRLWRRLKNCAHGTRVEGKYGYVDADGHNRKIYIEHQLQAHKNKLALLPRATRLAESVEVAYPQKSPDEAAMAAYDTVGIQLRHVKALLGATATAPINQGGSPPALQWEAVGLRTEDVKAAAQALDEGVDDLAAWRNWKPM